MTNLLINEPPLQVLPSLALEIGLNEAIVLQQVHYWLHISRHKYKGKKWFYKTYDEWLDEFPFWSKNTVVRAINSLEKKDLLISTSDFNKMKIDRTKWYTINYQNLVSRPSTQNEQSDYPIRDDTTTQDEYTQLPKMGTPITREYTETTTENTSEIENVVKHDNEPPPYHTIIDYLNQLAGTKYKHTTKKTHQLIRARYKEGFILDDFKVVIDKKVKTWLNDSKMNTYLRPETLFGTKFESYLNEKEGSKHGINQPNTPNKVGNVELGF